MRSSRLPGMLVNKKTHFLLSILTLVILSATANAEERLSFNTYQQIYPPVYPIAVTDFQFDTVTLTAQIFISTTRQCKFECRGKEIPFDGKKLVYTFQLADSDSIITETIDVIFENSKSYLELEYRSPQYFQKVGKSHYKHGFLTLTTDLPQLEETTTNYLDVNYRVELLELLKPSPSQSVHLETVKKLIDIFHNCKKRNNLPRANFNYGYLYLKAAIGDTHIFTCGGTSLIVRDSLRSVGVPARNVALFCSSKQKEPGPLVRKSQSHTTNELYVNGKWQWFDAYFRFLYVRDSREGTYLNTWQLIEYLSNPSKKSRLLFGVYNPKTKICSELALDEHLKNPKSSQESTRTPKLSNDRLSCDAGVILKEATYLKNTIDRYFTSDKELLFSN